MGKHHIKITQSFNAPVDEIFDILTDHETFGKIVNANIKRVIDSQGGNKNGLGSVRRIYTFPAPAFEETVILFQANQTMVYMISKGSPVKNHIGKMKFSHEQGITKLDYTIDFEPRLFFYFLGPFIKLLIEKPIRDGLKRLAESYIR